MHTINGHLIVELPEGAKDPIISEGDLLIKATYTAVHTEWQPLPPGSYTILCTLQEALDSEELAGKIVGNDENPVDVLTIECLHQYIDMSKPNIVLTPQAG